MTSPDQTTPQVRAAMSRIGAALPLRTDRVLLRPTAADDVAAVHAYRRLPEVSRYLPHEPLDTDGAQALVQRWLDDPAGVSVAIEVDGRVVGDVRLSLRPCSAMTPATTEEVEGWIGYAVHPDHQGRGLATEAVGAVVDLAMTQARVRRLTARVFAGATGSSRLLHRLGFTRDGVERAAVLSPEGDTWWDDESWSLLRDDVRRD